MYYNARYYDPHIGQFISPDTIVPDPSNVSDYNRYMYVSGNPVKYNDPMGHQKCEMCEQTLAYMNAVVRTASPDMIGTHSSVGVNAIIDVVGYERGIHFDFETNKIHKTSSWDTTVGVPEVNFDISRSFTWFHDDKNIDSEMALKGTSLQYDLGGSASIVGANATYEFNTQNAPENDITTISISGSIGPDGLPVDGHFGGSTTWIRHTESFGSNADMAVAIAQHRFKSGETTTFKHQIETAALFLFALYK